MRPGGVRAGDEAPSPICCVSSRTRRFSARHRRRRIRRARRAWSRSKTSSRSSSARFATSTTARPTRSCPRRDDAFRVQREGGDRRHGRAARPRDRGRRLRDGGRLRADAPSDACPAVSERFNVRRTGRRDSRSGGGGASTKSASARLAAARPRGRRVKAGARLFDRAGRTPARSTLLNRFAGQKLAIVSDKPQTTRPSDHRRCGTCRGGQIVFIDTPGIHKPQHRMNRRMVDLSLDTLRDVDVVVLVGRRQPRGRGAGDEFVTKPAAAGAQDRRARA